MWLPLLLVIEAISSVLGKCKKTLIDPVCSEDGMTYANRCLFDNAQERNPDLKIVHEGVCKCDSESAKRNPICISKGPFHDIFCEYRTIRGNREHDSVVYVDLCTKFIKKKKVAGTVFKEIFLWKTIMPQDYDKLMSRNKFLQYGKPGLKRYKQEQQNRLKRSKKGKLIKEKLIKEKLIKEEQRKAKQKKAKQKKAKQKKAKQKEEKIIQKKYIKKKKNKEKEPVDIYKLFNLVKF